MSDIVIQGGKLIDGNGGPPIDESVVVIRDGVFETVGARDEAAVPAGAEVIDASGRTVMPGLVDAHWHVGGEFKDVQTLRMALARGITTIATVCGGPAGVKLRKAIEERHVLPCSRYVVGCIVNATNGHVKGRTADGPWEVRKAVREMVQAGADFIKTAASGGFWAQDEKCSWQDYTYEELEALVDEAHSVDKSVAVHVHTQPGLNNAIKAGADMIHHGAFIDDEALAGIKEKDLFFIPTLRVTCDKNINAWPDRPWMMEEMKQAQPIHRRGVRKAHEMGIKIGLGTDGPGSSHTWTPGDATPWELMELVQCGLSPLEAITAGTRTTAAALGMDDAIGTIEPAKKADVLIVDADPLEDIASLYEADNILLVVKDGRKEVSRMREIIAERCLFADSRTES